MYIHDTRKDWYFNLKELSCIFPHTLKSKNLVHLPILLTSSPRLLASPLSAIASAKVNEDLQLESLEIFVCTCHILFFTQNNLLFLNSHWSVNHIFQFDLVCDNAYKSELSTTVYFGGVLVGSLIYGFLADKYGRKPILGIALLSGGLLSLAIFIFQNFYAFAVLRFFLGIQTQVNKQRL